MKRILLFVAIIATGGFMAKAQKLPFSDLAVGVNVGTYGPGFSVATNLLSSNLILRAGLDFAGYSYNVNEEIDVNYGGISVYGVTIDDAKLKFSNAKLLVDYYPMKNGVFSLTGGFFMGKNKISVDGYAEEKFELEGIVIAPENGRYSADLVLGNNIKPYLGIGLGRSIAKNRVGFRFDLGVVFQGKYKIESKNIMDEYVINQGEKLIDDLDIPDSLTKYWPMLNFSLSYRIF